MKKFLQNSIVCVLHILLAAGCGRDAEPQSGGAGKARGRVSVVATSFAPFDFARMIAGGRAEVAMLLPPGAESHSFEPTPRDVIRVKNCDLFIHVGGKSDAWVEALLNAAEVDRKKVVTLMDCVAVVEEKFVEGMQRGGHGGHGGHDDHEHDGHARAAQPEYDEHVWTSPKNALLIVQKISAALAESDPANANAYLMNTLNCIGNLVLLDYKFESLADSAARKTIVFGDRFPFRYLADAYGLEYFAAFPGCASETEPSAATMKFLIDKINDEKIPVVFHIELSSRKIADAISEATGAKVLQLHSCHNVSKSDFKRGATYLGLMSQNVENLREALR